MQKKFLILFIFIVTALFNITASAQIMSDSIVVTGADTAIQQEAKKFNPRTATIRSALIPGWGQAYNKKYWKIPLVYAALGVTGGIFSYNIKTYKQLRRAYIYKSDLDTSNDILIDASLRNFSKESLRTNRNTFRQNIDYSVLFFIVFWGLNVVDATVDAQLKGFDVSDDLSVYLKPGYSEMANTAGISIVMKIGK